jgi:HEAT repeat protein
MPLGDYLWDVANDAIEDIATLRHHRIPDAGASWRSVARSEERLLSQLDAVLSCGEEVVRRAERSARSPEIPDPDRLFAVILILGCWETRDSVAMAVDLLRIATTGTADELSAAVDALCLAPHPGCAEALLALLADSSATVRAAAVRILAYREGLPGDDLLALFRDDDPGVLEQAALAAGDFRDPKVTRALEGCLFHPEESVVRAALRSAIRNRSRAGLEAARTYCRDGRAGFADAALFLGLAGASSDVTQIRSCLAMLEPPASGVRGAGFLGDPNLVPDLIGCLERLKDDQRREAAHALERITAAGLQVTEEVPVHDPEDLQYLEGTPPMEEQKTIVQDPVIWRAWWSANQTRFDPGLRYRRGQRYSPDVLLDELDRGECSPAERGLIHDELAAIAGAARGEIPRFRALDFIPRQEAGCGAWRQLLAAGHIRFAPGSFTTEREWT